MHWNDLKRIIRGWLRWHRFCRAVNWGMRGMAVILGIVIFLMVILIPRHLMNAIEYLGWCFLGAIAGMCAGFLIGLIWPVNEGKMMHFFDLTLGLQERVSTAVEVQRIVSRNLPGKDVMMSGWRDRQLQDTISTTQKVKISQAIPFRWERPVLLLVYAMGFFLLVLWVISQPQFLATDQERQATRYIKMEIARLQVEMNDIKNSSNLSDEQKKALSVPFQNAIERLQAASNPDQALAALNQAEIDFKNMSTATDNKQIQIYQNLGRILSQNPQSPLRNIGSLLAAGDLNAASRVLQNLNLTQITSAEKQLFVSELKQAGEAIKLASPQLSADLLDASRAIDQGRLQDAQNILNNIGKAVAQTGDQVVEAQVAQNVIGTLQQHQDIVSQDVNNIQRLAATVVALQKTPLATSVAPGLQGSSGNNLNGLNSADFEPVYAPQSQNSSADNGESNSNNTPYINVLSAYKSENNKSIQNGSVPAYLQPVIRDYLDSLDPNK